MFRAKRWAAAFAAAAGERAEAALDIMEALLPPLRRIPSLVSGSAAAARLEPVIRRALARSGGGAGEAAAETALGTVLLLMRKGLLKHGEALAAEIRRLLDRQRGILAVTVESAFPLDGEYRAALTARLKERTGAAEVRLEITELPELLGGCRLRMDSEILDASLLGQLEKMEKALRHPGGI
ncbi:MAG: F0F1 ATP synthase subunit delta [Spirochaetaceae bacterium]|jgi:F-type H+-transporting ATPase subunit delta|nr:F0F1 ATP synthase subunit delta [Spirochaetaceae bacterium]